MPVQISSVRQEPLPAAEPFLRIPPFPGSKISQFTIAATSEEFAIHTADIAELIRDLRVGGTFWAAQPKLPARFFLVRTAAPADCCSAIANGIPLVHWLENDPLTAANEARFVVTGDCDPWHMLAGAAGVLVDAEDELKLIAALLNVPTYVRDAATGELHLQEPQLETELRSAIPSAAYFHPFTCERMRVREAIELCGFWRRLIDKNRELGGGFGFAFWKQDNVGALMWGGAKPFQFLRTASDLGSGDAPIAVWRSKVPATALAELEEQGRPLIEVEDGFLRSHGLGADCIPPLSITVDSAGAYFDPARPSELETLLQEAVFDEQLIGRARRLRQLIVDVGLSKYSRGDVEVDRRVEARRHILVPGQVEDDRSVQTGGCGLSTNLDLLMRVREQAPDAYILYKPHPDVVAGHRTGAIPDRVCLQYADEIAPDAPISSLIAMVDEIHVNTSLAGFEALMREKQVTTYGVPFYAGWGLTWDLGPVPARRSSKRTLDELVAATLLLYPRYLDPETGLPCPPEVVVARLSAGQVPDTNMVVAVRRLQGKLMRGVRSLVQ
jgi:capsular polysaccharide export protein